MKESFFLRSNEAMQTEGRTLRNWAALAPITIVIWAVIIAVALALASAASARERPHPRRRHHVPWCGLYMMHVTGKRDPRLARAIEWRREGYDAGGPCVGCIVVWPHHVGRIVGRDGRGQWIVNSGNDGNAVRTRPRSLAGAVAFRRLYQ